MKIVIETGGGTTGEPFRKIILADDLGGIPIQDKNTSGQQAFERAEFVRAGIPKFFDRGNEDITLTFSTARQHGSFNEAEVFILEHIADLPRQALVVITANAGPAARSRFLPNALIERPRLLQHIGETTLWSYAIHAAQVVRERPAG